MRTTIEISPEHRARILKLAASRGEKGFSGVVSDALDLYLEVRDGAPCVTEAMVETGKRIAAHPDLDRRGNDEILGYNGFGAW